MRERRREREGERERESEGERDREREREDCTIERHAKELEAHTHMLTTSYFRNECLIQTNTETE